MTQTTNSSTDGGYYAIKGFAYQIDKTIIEILESEDENKVISIEKIQDVNTDDYVMQVKYKEAATFTPSKIKYPAIQLIDEYKKDSSKKYMLFAYFGDMNGYENFVDDKNRITIDKLNNILGNKSEKFSEPEKKGFIKAFNLDFSPEFQTQYEQVLSLLKEISFIGSEEEEVVFYYSNITEYLKKLITDNPTDIIENRACTKKIILDFLKRGSGEIFNSSFRKYRGEIEYFKHIKNKYFTNTMNVNDYERFVLIELSGSETVSSIKEVVSRVKNKFYKKTGSILKRIKSGAPYIYISNITDKKLIKLKTEFQSEGTLFIDGYDFNGANFSLASIMKKTTTSNNIELKLIDSENNFNTLVKQNYGKPKEIYQFYMNEGLDIEIDIKNIKIQTQQISDISSII